MDIIKQKDIDLILGKMLSSGGQFSEIYFEESDSAGFSFIDKKVETSSSGTVSGCGLRLIKGEQTYFASQSNPSVVSLISLAEIFMGQQQTQKQAEPHTTHGVHCVHGVQVQGEPIKIEQSSIAEITEELLPYLKVIENLDKTLRAKSSQIKQLSFRVSSGRKSFFVANSNKTTALNKRSSAIFTVAIVMSDGKITQTAHEVIAEESLKKIKYENIEKVSLVAYQRVSNLLNNAISSPAGEMPIVISSSAGGTMIHEAIGHSLEADAIQKGISPVYLGKIGKKVASEKITVKSTGKGRRKSYHQKPIPRMSNTYIAPGRDNPEDIVKSIEKGIFVTKMGGGQVNTANGDFIFEVEEGYELNDGKIGRMLRNASLIGNGPEILNSIDMVGNDIGWQPGTCGKDGQGVPVLDGQPTLRIPKITVGGT